MVYGTLTLWLAVHTFCAQAAAQYREPKPCMPFGSFADELRARGIGVPAQPVPPALKFRIAKVGFRGVTQLPNSELKKLVASLKSQEFEDDDQFLPALEEIEVRGFWQDRGYFRVQAKVVAQVYGNPADRKVAVGISVEEGMRYRLRNIRFVNVDDTPLHFPESQLRALIPLRDGELFYVDQIRKGLDALKQLYGEVGYIDFTSEPRTEEHDAAEISLLIRLDPNKQFHISRITVLGLPPEKQAQLKWNFKEGDVFSPRHTEAFFKANKHVLPTGASETNVRILRDLSGGTVDLTFVFAKCVPYPFDLP